MKTSKDLLKSTKNSLTRTYFFINALINRCENLKILSKNVYHGVLLPCTYKGKLSTMNRLIST